MPQETADELKATGTATPKYYEQVSVLITDFSDFSRISTKLTPQEIIKELEECFLAFDGIIERHNLEKIKTMGDSYMCAGGIPMANQTNAKDCITAAIEMQQYMIDRYKEKTKNKIEYWQMRLGIHTGPLVAGVVGKNKFAYDIWGDTVNTAKRMEEAATTDMINISKSTYQKTQNYYETKYRGKHTVKNIGEIDMYEVIYDKTIT